MNPPGSGGGMPPGHPYMQQHQQQPQQPQQQQYPAGWRGSGDAQSSRQGYGSSGAPSGYSGYTNPSVGSGGPPPSALAPPVSGYVPASSGAVSVAPSSTPTLAFGARPKAGSIAAPQQQAFSAGGSSYAASSAAAAAAGGGAPPRPPRARLGPQLLATCPLLCIARTAPGGAPDALPLTVTNLQYDALVYVSQAFVKVHMMAEYPPINGYEDRPIWLFVPKSTNTTITDLAVENQTRGCVYATAVVPREETSRFGKGGGDGLAMASEALTRDPELFMLPLAPGIPGDKFKVTFTYLQPLEFEEGRYRLRLPTTLPPAVMPKGMSVNGVLDVSATINSGAPGQVEWRLGSHPATVVEQQPGSVVLTLNGEEPWPNDDVAIDYGVWRKNLTATLHVSPPAAGGGDAEDDPAAAMDPRGSFVLMVSPPGPECSTPFCRSVVFMFDRSGSMAGEPLAHAKAALAAGLRLLTPADQFTVVAFDHEQLWWTEPLCDATPANVAACTQWVMDNVSARGTTDIMCPLQRAVRMLQGGARGLPFIFLITDGCVENEHDICRFVEAATSGGAGGGGPPLYTATTGATTIYEDAASTAFSLASAPTTGSNGTAGTGGLPAGGGPMSVAPLPPSTAAGSWGPGAPATPSVAPPSSAYAPTIGGPAGGGPQPGSAGFSSTGSGASGGSGSYATGAGSYATGAGSYATGAGSYATGAGSYATGYAGGAANGAAPTVTSSGTSAGGGRPPLEPRFFTFGIGPYCNHFFLKQLATIGRGLNDSALRPQAVRTQMERMLVAAAAPLLSDVMLLVQGVSSCELFPPVLPDVFCGLPLLVVGKYEGAWPKEAQLRGVLPTGEEYLQPLPMLPMGPLPVDQLFAKGRLDLWVAQAWMEGNPPELVQKIVDLSVASGVTTPHTTMVGFETTTANFAKFKSLPAAQRRAKIIKWAIGGAAGVGIVVGVTLAATFGSLAATVANTPVDAAMAVADMNLMDLVGDGGGCGDCGGCDGCGDCQLC